MDAKELSALYEVLGALLDDPSWPQLHPHPCTDTPWPGVQCETLPQQQQQPDPFFHVTKLHVGPDLATPPCRPGAELSLSLLRLPFLKTLSIFGCFVGATVTLIPPPLFSSASSLEQLVLISNRGLSGPIPTTISLAGRLSVLRLSQNDLRGEIPRGVGELRELKQLDLSYNRLTGGIPEELGGLAGLGILDLSFNGLRGGIPRSLGRLCSLQKLDLGSNSLSGRIPEETGMLRKLVLLDLSRNSITGPVPEALSGLEELEYFLVENNPIGSGVPLFLGAGEAGGGGAVRLRAVGADTVVVRVPQQPDGAGAGQEQAERVGAEEPGRARQTRPAQPQPEHAERGDRVPGGLRQQAGEEAGREGQQGAVRELPLVLRHAVVVVVVWTRRRRPEPPRIAAAVRGRSRVRNK
ncbi:piriformospora indica-insensitive protein 2-like [Iris pallida]|uniref:Piriformospora indica-insensitive protein 2-like n=1 Tax=Iris pallida TaxID=29817 RepID=A0AAX6HSQ0_IRIPA|nr:piriformospora indica-insensitive protein 2-like [Iris pallida]